MFYRGVIGNLSDGYFDRCYNRVEKMSEIKDGDYLTALENSNVKTVRAAIREATKDL